MDDNLDEEDIIDFENGNLEEFKTIILGFILEQFRIHKEEIPPTIYILISITKGYIEIKSFLSNSQSKNNNDIISKVSKNDLKKIFNHFKPNIKGSELNKEQHIYYNFIELFQKPNNHLMIDINYKLDDFKKKHPDP